MDMQPVHRMCYSAPPDAQQENAAHAQPPVLAAAAAAAWITAVHPMGSDGEAIVYEGIRDGPRGRRQDKGLCMCGSFVLRVRWGGISQVARPHVRRCAAQ
eukprot:8343767-Alexandrium_andersonii.AAC.1